MLPCVGGDGPGALRKMAFDRNGIEHRGLAEPGRHTVGKDRQFLAIVFDLAGEIALPRLETRRRQRRQADEIETVTGIDRLAQRLQPLMEQPADQRGFADGTRRADSDAADHAVDPEQQKLQRARALARGARDRA